MTITLFKSKNDAEDCTAFVCIAWTFVCVRSFLLAFDVGTSVIFEEDQYIFKNHNIKNN